MSAPLTEGEASRPVAGGKSPSAFRTITEVANELDLPQHVLRFWETRFPQIRPMKRRGGRRYYRPEDVVMLREVRRLLYVEGYTIRGVQKLLRQQGRRALAQAPRASAVDDRGEAGDDAHDDDGISQPAEPAGSGDRETAAGPGGAAVEASSPSSPKWRRDMEMSTVLRKELFDLLCELEELRALLPPRNSGRPE
ncbi:MAG: MerR family transcriptional regulator [Rhodospirillales bacterium]|nr:MerR family transcriptional regulator [Rhodospirillales bacterium]